MNFGVKLEVQMTKEEITEKVLGWQKESKNEKLYPIVIGTYKNRKKNILTYINRNKYTPIYIVLYVEDFIDSHYNETYEFMKGLDPAPKNFIKCNENLYKDKDDYYVEDIVDNLHIIRLKVEWRGILPKRTWIQKNLNLDKYWLVDDDIQDKAALRTHYEELNEGGSRKSVIDIEDAMKMVQCATHSLSDEVWGCAGMGNEIACCWYDFDKLYREESFNCNCVLVNNKTLQKHNIWYSLEPADDDIKLCVDILEAGLKNIQCHWLSWFTWYADGTGVGQNKSTMQTGFNEFALNNYVCMRDYVTLWIKKDKIKTRINPKRIYSKTKIIGDDYHNKLYELCLSGDCDKVYEFIQNRV